MGRNRDYRPDRTHRPTILVESGHVLSGRLRGARLTEEEILEAARRTHGLERMDEIKFAILEASGQISIIPRRKTAAGDSAAPG